MSDIKLFRLAAGKAVELRGDACDLEQPLQTLIENNLEALLGTCVTCVACGVNRLPPDSRVD